MVKWTDTGRLVSHTVYTFTWGIVGRVPWYLLPDSYALSTHLYRLIRDRVTNQASVPRGYPRYSELQNVTIFQVRAPIYELEKSIHIEEILDAGERIISTYTDENFNIMVKANHFMPPAGPLAGEVLSLPGAFMASMNSDGSVTDPTGIPDDSHDYFGFREVLAPAKTAVTWGLVGVSVYGIYRIYKGMESVPLPQSK